jgi:hypothetical protein
MDHWIKKDHEPSILSHRKIRNRELEAQRQLHSKNSDMRYRKIPRRLVSRPSQRTGGSRSTHRHIGISEFVVLKDRSQQDFETREITIREIAIRSQPSICLDTWRTSRKPSVFRHLGFQVDREVDRKSRYPEVESGPSIFPGRVA